MLMGGDGDDKLYGEYGDDTLEGSTGNDYLSGGTGNDVYIFGLGDGTDTIYDYDKTEGNKDILSFKEGISAEDVLVSRVGDNLELSVRGTADKVVVQNYFYTGNTYYRVEEVRFADGTVWDYEYVKDASRHIEGTEDKDSLTGYEFDDVINGYGGNDTINSGYGNDIVYGGAGNDTLYGGYGNDMLMGGDGNDSLYGEYGDDTLEGSTGNDYLSGGTGNDTYIFGLGDGADTVYDYDTISGNKDTVSLGADILNIIFSKNGNNLDLNINGTDDKLSVQYWSFGSAYQIEEFRAADGSMLLNTQVDLLIQAMASFSDQNGMSWSKAAQDRPQEVQDILSQFWVTHAQ